MILLPTCSETASGLVTLGLQSLLLALLPKPRRMDAHVRIFGAKVPNTPDSKVAIRQLCHDRLSDKPCMPGTYCRYSAQCSGKLQCPRSSREALRCCVLLALPPPARQSLSLARLAERCTMRGPGVEGGPDPQGDLSAANAVGTVHMQPALLVKPTALRASIRHTHGQVVVPGWCAALLWRAHFPLVTRKEGICLIDSLVPCARDASFQ